MSATDNDKLALLAEHYRNLKDVGIYQVTVDHVLYNIDRIKSPAGYERLRKIIASEGKRSQEVKERVRETFKEFFRWG